MSTLTEIRDGLAKALAPIPERTSISLIGGKYDERMERFSVRILVGEPSPEGEMRLNELLAADSADGVCGLIERDPTLGAAASVAVVRSHSGHRAFEQPGDAPDELGTALEIEVLR